jgi:hypothetical protein
MKNNKIIQNAVKITENGKITYLVSSHVHDFNTYQFQDGKTISVDGGIGEFGYLRKVGDLFDKRIEDFSLVENDDFNKIKHRLLWGHYNKDGTGDLRYSLVKDLTKTHLKAILKEYKGQLDVFREKTIRYWLNFNKK